jgi:NTP pyrophosphatase (non-canonical NTP hydrolase)
MQLRPDQIHEIDELSRKAHRPLTHRGLKLAEETGEVSAAIQSYEGQLGTEYKQQTVEDVKEEIIDTMLVLYSMLSDLEVSEEEFQSIIDKKIAKWRKVTGG